VLWGTVRSVMSLEIPSTYDATVAKMCYPLTYKSAVCLF
jgi:hypothetical protein